MRNIEVKNCVHVVAGIIRHPLNPAKLFFTQRQKGQHLEDFWEFPGGKVEPGESRFHALQRELEEETGIRVISALPFHSVIHQYKDKNIYLDVWEIKKYTGRAHGREGQSSQWIYLSELSDYPFPAADIPVLNSLSLPSELLITSEISTDNLQTTLLRFEEKIRNQKYPLILFRSHQLADKNYADIAIKLKEICDNYNSELIISRPDLQSLKSKQFDLYIRRHIDAEMLTGLSRNSFAESLVLSADCRNSKELKIAEDLNCNFGILSFQGNSNNQFESDIQNWYQFHKSTLTSRIPVFTDGCDFLKDIAVARYQGATGLAISCTDL